jgi:hypothetical protein
MWEGYRKDPGVSRWDTVRNTRTNVENDGLAARELLATIGTLTLMLAQSGD